MPVALAEPFTNVKIHTFQETKNYYIRPISLTTKAAATITATTITIIKYMHTQIKIIYAIRFKP